jgi:hypothetical protein
MRRISRLVLLSAMVSFLALLPTNVLAAGVASEYVLGVEYAVGTCTGGDSGTFAGIGSATQGGQPNAVFNTTICHSAFAADRTASILPGGTFMLATSSVKLAGEYRGGQVGPGVVTPLYPGSTFLCKEAFPVGAALGPIANPPQGFTNIKDGIAAGTLMHIGLFAAGGGCQAFAAAITGGAVLSY